MQFVSNRCKDLFKRKKYFGVIGTLRRMCQAGFGAKGDMNNNHVLQLLYKVSWLHHERPSQYKSMYVSQGILSKEPPLPSLLLTPGGHTTMRHFNGT